MWSHPCWVHKQSLSSLSTCQSNQSSKVKGRGVHVQIKQSASRLAQNPQGPLRKAAKKTHLMQPANMFVFPFVMARTSCECAQRFRERQTYYTRAWEWANTSSTAVTGQNLIWVVWTEFELGRVRIEKSGWRVFQPALWVVPPWKNRWWRNRTRCSGNVKKDLGKIFHILYI